MTNTSDVIGALLELGLDEKNAADFSKNSERASEYIALCAKHGASSMELRKRKMAYNVFQKVKNPTHCDFAMNWLFTNKVKTTAQVTAMINFLSKLSNDSTIDEKILGDSCGVGIEVSNDEILAAVQQALSIHMEKLKEEKYNFNSGQIIRLLTKSDSSIRWAEGSTVKMILDSEIEKVLGSRSENENSKVSVSKEKTCTNQPKPSVAPCKEESRMLDDYRHVGEGLKRIRIETIPQHSEQVVYICGWAHRVRHQSKMSFIVLRDGTGFVQVVFGFKIPHFHRETSLAIVGSVCKEPKAQGDNKLQIPFEVHVNHWAIIGSSDGEIENLVTGDSAPDVLFDQRHITLRGNLSASTMIVRASLLRAFREFFHKSQILEVTPPTMVQTQCEGGSTLFELNFYDEKAYLTQSSQLYLETCLPSMGDVYCILSSYRAEKSKTRRHLSEYTHVEAELANITFNDLLNFLEDMMVAVMGHVFREVGHLIVQHNNDAIRSSEHDPNEPSSWKIMPEKPFARLKYSEAIALLRKHNIMNPDTNEHYVEGDDIPDKAERELVSCIGKPILLTHFPANMKAFYMSRVGDDRSLTESVDVLMPGVGETVGGSMRLWDYEELMAAYKKNDLDPKPYYWYTDQRKFGSVPHGGFGLGLERLLMWLLQLDHVKEACLYPRLMGRCKP